MNTFSRRGFLRRAATMGAAGTLGLASIAGADEAAGGAPADTVAWDGVYDVVIAGMGAAGCSAAIYAAKAGAEVLLFDVAPEWEAGGNSRYCGQFVCIGHDKDMLMDYYRATYGEFPYDEAVIDALTDGQLELTKWAVEDFGCAEDELVSWKEQGLGKAEFPEHPGSDTIDMFTVGNVFSSSKLFKKLQRCVYDSDAIDIWFDARGTKLVQDPQTKTVMGIQIEKDGEVRSIAARNGVILTCGGFENNDAMKADYLNIPVSRPLGTVWNRGDGIRMAQEINADLWHMNCYEVYPGTLCGPRIDPEVCPHGVQVVGTTRSFGFEGGSFVLVGADGRRFLNETGSHRHGHHYYAGEWKVPQITSTAYLVFDSAKMDEISTLRWNDGVEECIVSADSIEELAVALGLADPSILATTVERFNAFAEAGEDLAFERSAQTMAPVAQAPFYGIPMIPNVLNTQGGPRRNADAHIVDTAGNPIPHLYSAGELGGLTGRDYQGATNIAECLVFGRIAGTNAALETEPLSSIDASALAFTPGSGSDETPQERIYDLADNEYVGTSHDGMGGDVDVKITMDGDAIAAVEVVYEHETKGLGSAAVRQLPGDLLEAQSLDGVEIVSGATVSSGAIMAAFQNALAQVK